jgi:hypothetical protein
MQLVPLHNGMHCGSASPTCSSASSSLIEAMPGVCENHVPTAEEVASAVAHVTDGDFAVVGLAGQYGESVRRLKAVLAREHVASVLGGGTAIRTDPGYKAHLERVRVATSARAAASLGGGPGGGSHSGGGGSDDVDAEARVAAVGLEEELAPMVPHGGAAQVEFRLPIALESAWFPTLEPIK